MSAPFRISKRATVREGERNGLTTQSFKDYLERLLKMIPGEIVGLYLIGNGIVPSDDPRGQLIWIGITFVLLIIFRIWGTSDKKEKKAWQPMAVFVSALSFLIWVYSLGGPFILYGKHYPKIASLAILVWTFLIPIIYKGSDDSE